jgi:hypothetical protein
MIKVFAKYLVGAVFLYVLVLFLYILTWQGIVAGVIPLSFGFTAPSNYIGSSTNQTLTISASAEMIVYRYGFLPVYWSRIGDLTVYHQICFSLLTFELVAASVLKYKRLTFPKQKLLKPKISIPMHGGAQMPKTDKKGKASRLILTVWAFIGFLWFIVYQLLPVLPYDTSLVLVELLNYAMWIMVFASAGTLVLPYLKVLYYKIWEGGEKHE